jgi:hypothetical protein
MDVIEALNTPWGLVATILTIIGMVYGFIRGFVRPRTKWGRLHTLYEKLKEWHEDFLQNFEDPASATRLNLRERSISEFIKDHDLGGYQFDLSEKVRSRFLASMGIKKELGSSKEWFERYAKFTPEFMDVSTLWIMISTSAWQFKSAWPNITPQNGIQNVENRITFLKVYLGIKSQ